MKKEDIIRKLTSRKLWMSVASFVSMMLVYFGQNENEAAQVASLIMAGATVLGYVLADAIFPFQLTTQAIIVALCYTVAMVPISGRFGSLAGVIAGMIHATIVTTVVTFHGGFLLYNGGFTCAITVIMLLPVLELFFEPQDHLALLPKLKKKDSAG